MKLKDLLNEVTKLSEKSKEILISSKYNEFEDLSSLDINYDDKEELFLLEELNNILYKIEDINNKIDYLYKPIILEGKILKNESGRYQVENYEYNSGDIIEALVYDSNYEDERWIKTSVEHDGKDYYLVGYKGINMDGLLVRVRKC